MVKLRALRTDAAKAEAAELPPDVRLMNACAALLAAIGVLAVLAVLALWGLRQPVFDLRRIQIEGDVARNSVATLRANAAPQLAGNYFTLSLTQARKAFESVPWVRHAAVRRIWPNRLAVQLEEHRPVALWGGGEASTDKLVNSYGEVFEANLGDIEDDGLPTLQGPEGSALRMLSLLQRLVPVLAPIEASVDTLALSGRGSWRAELDSGAHIELGRGSDDEVVERALRFVSTLPQVLARHQRALEYADLRHHDGYAVRLQGISTGVVPVDKKPRKK
ncbi:MAG: cell division protein FtsQ/DivIB [Burkholderiaceae bacterium]